MFVTAMRCTFLRLLACSALLSCAPGQGQLLVRASMSASIQVDLPTPPPPKPAVALDGAAVVEFFGVPLDDAQDVIFVLDVSGSMQSGATGRLAQLQGHKTPQPSDGSATTASGSPPPGAPPPPQRPSTKIEVARAELMSAIERLPSGTRLNIIFFNNSLVAFDGQLAALDETRRRQMLDFVAAAGASGGTALAPAMRTALMLNARRVVLLSDGQGNVGGDSYDVLRDAREAMRGGVRIDAIGIGSHDRSLMSALATESGGLYQAL